MTFNLWEKNGIKIQVTPWSQQVSQSSPNLLIDSLSTSASKKTSGIHPTKRSQNRHFKEKGQTDNEGVDPLKMMFFSHVLSGFFSFLQIFVFPGIEVQVFFQLDDEPGSWHVAKWQKKSTLTSISRKTSSRCFKMTFLSPTWRSLNL